jgi:hypothetical protein
MIDKVVTSRGTAVAQRAGRPARGLVGLGVDCAVGGRAVASLSRYLMVMTAYRRGRK